MLAHAGACIVWAEALSIRRELHSGWTSGWQDNSTVEQGDDEEDHQAPLMGQANRRQSTHVLFDGDNVDNDEGAKMNGKHANGHGPENIEMKRIN
jgi:hypothetical protein